jgi:uncharacterized membrane protein YqjE
MAAARQPGLVLEHAGAYAELASAELDEWGDQWKSRASLGTAAALLAYLALALAGAAGLALAVVPVAAMPMPWLLAVIPAAPLLLAAVFAWRVRRMKKTPPFAALRDQVAQDLATLRILDAE